LAWIVFSVIITMIIAYFIGGINFAIIITKISKNEDIRNFGSGNAGTTNVLRSVGRKEALFTFIFDFIKCVIAVLIGRWLIGMSFTAYNVIPSQIGSNLGAYFAGFACIIGHMYPPYFKFKGGKGVVTTAAMMLLIDWRVFCIMFTIFIIVFLIKKIVSLSSIVGTALYPLGTFFITYYFDYTNSPLQTHGEMPLWYIIAATVLSALTGWTIVVKHKANIKRLIEGTEKPISFKNK
jgi:glycerol-3-phosphate acyltransferase PlsY